MHMVHVYTYMQANIHMHKIKISKCFLKTHFIIYYITPIPYIYKYWEQTDKRLSQTFSMSIH